MEDASDVEAALLDRLNGLSQMYKDWRETLTPPWVLGRWPDARERNALLWAELTVTVQSVRSIKLATENRGHLSHNDVKELRKAAPPAITPYADREALLVEAEQLGQDAPPKLYYGGLHLDSLERLGAIFNEEASRSTTSGMGQGNGVGGVIGDGEDADPDDWFAALADVELSETFTATFDWEVLGSALKHAGVHPDDVITLLRYAPLGLVHLTWRNSVLEHWHAGPDSRISDPQMMQANVDTARIFREHLWEAFADSMSGYVELHSQYFDERDVEALGDAFFAAFEEAFAAERLLPHGASLGDLGGDELGELRAHAETQLLALSKVAVEEGVGIVLMWLALRGRLTSNYHWGSPLWPRVVEEFMRRLDNPEHPCGQPRTTTFPLNFPKSAGMTKIWTGGFCRPDSWRTQAGCPLRRSPSASTRGDSAMCTWTRRTSDA